MKKSIRILFIFALLLSLSICACAPSQVVQIMPGIQNTYIPSEEAFVQIQTPEPAGKTNLPSSSDPVNPTAAPENLQTPQAEQNPDIPADGTLLPGTENEPMPAETSIADPVGIPSEKPAPLPDEDTPAAGENNTVYFTFDDGPCALTPQLLDILDEYNIKATFFTVGYFVDRHPEIIRDAAARGHLIACHTYSHDFSRIYSSAGEFMQDVHKWEEAVIRALGKLPPQVCVRFPGGSHNSFLDETMRLEIINALEYEGYRWYDWDFGDNDKWLAGNTENLPINEYLMHSYKISLNWIAGTDKPLIFLAHDTSAETMGVIRNIIEDLIAKGYRFSTLSECPVSHLAMH